MIHSYKCFFSSACEEKTVSLVPRFLLTHAAVLHFFFTKAPRCLKLLIPASNAIGRWGITVELSLECPLNRNNWFVLHKLQHTHNAFCSRVAIIALLRHRPREKRGVGLRMRTKLEHLLFHSMWATYFCVRFESRNDRLKLLQSFWYTLYVCTPDCCFMKQQRPALRYCLFVTYACKVHTHRERSGDGGE